jgi:predicted small secreted protein
MFLRSARIVGVLALALSAAACNTTGGLPAGQHSTIAFDRVDGLPPAVFDRYVRKLNEEAEAKKVPVVTREGFAPYRIKGYASVWTKGRQATMSWVWEVFDSNGERVVRIAGDEKAGSAGRDAWQAVNDEVLARAARSGMEQLAVYFRGPDTHAQAVATAAPEAAPPPATDQSAPSRQPVTAGRIAAVASPR